ncbi:MAG: VOC family protein [Bacteroidota bacterium]
MKKMNPVVHFEMPTEDRERSIGFYSKVFGWEMKVLGEDMGNYILATTCETDDKGIPKQPAMINGGIYTRDKLDAVRHPSFVITVDDMDEHMKLIEEAGGRIDGKPIVIKGFGLYVNFYDTENNMLTIMQPTEEMEKKADKASMVQEK